ncbi:MAG: hypothetical protein SGPRY_005401, partial [Prymnesium sp.]
TTAPQLGCARISFAESGKAVRKGGRKATGLGNWSFLEDTAGVLAAVDAYEQRLSSADAQREAAAAAAFPAWMDYCIKELGLVFHNRWQSKGSEKRLITYEVARAERSVCGAIMKRFKQEFLKYAKNIIMPGYHQFLTSNGELPSGTTRADHEKAINEYIWRHEQAEKNLLKAKRVKKGAEGEGEEDDCGVEEGAGGCNDAAEPEPEREGGEGGEPAGEASSAYPGGFGPVVEQPAPVNIPPMPADYNGGRWFVAWKELGPWGKKHPSIAEATASGLPVRSADDSRRAMKKAEEAAASKKREKGAVFVPPSELHALLKLVPDDPKAKAELIELLCSEPEAVPDV